MEKRGENKAVWLSGILRRKTRAARPPRKQSQTEPERK